MQEKFNDRKNYDLIIGVDAGTHTGFAIWNVRKAVFDAVKAVKIHQAIFELIELRKTATIKVLVEDARLRTWFGSKGREALQGAGSIKRDCTVWEDFLTDYNFDFQLIAPKSNKTKLNAKTFQSITKYKGSTNEHSRDAAMLCFNRTY
jgi:hypothetical protein